ncbi:hypothetical protein GF415_01570 [Candidatus Micrarchaeota archaeon]|nr:hypothetical protein [Candidatus Micrarchaeota archaeon]
MAKKKNGKNGRRSHMIWKKFIIGVIIALGSVGALWIIDIWDFGDALDTSTKTVNIDFDETTHLNNIKFYYFGEDGQLNFTFYQPFGDLTHFSVEFPRGIETEGFQIVGEDGTSVEGVFQDIANKGTEREHPVFVREGDIPFPVGETFHVSINITGELQPVGRYVFARFSNRTIENRYDIYMGFRDWECLDNCADVLSGQYDEFLTTPSSNYQIVSSNKWKINSKYDEAIQLNLNMKRTSMRTKDYWSYFSALIFGILISLVLSWEETKT